LDQQMALRFIRRHVEAFGGDSRRVTVLGHSSGGTSIFALMASPASLGLFDAAITLSGSPNISMSRPEAQRMQDPLIQAVNCSDPNIVADCLHALPPETIQRLTPSGWSADSFFPVDPDGLDCVPLVIVDGVTIPSPLLQALATPVIDVPFLLQYVRDEDAAWTDDNVASVTANGFDAFLQHHFATWPSQTSEELATLYQNVSSGKQAYYDLSCDIGVGCGHNALAQVAARSMRSPVYLAVVMQAPGAFFAVNGTPIAMPFHGYDFSVAFGIWDPFAAWGSATPPSESDLALGSVLRSQWRSLAAHGSLNTSAVGFDPVGGDGQLATALQYADGAVVVRGYKAHTCHQLERLGLDQRFWWIN